MKQRLLPFVLMAIIAILAAALVYQIHQRRASERFHEQFGIAFGVQLYQGLQDGDIVAVKRRLGGFVAANSLLYEQKYGHETDGKFAPRLEEAKAIRATFQAGDN